MKDLCHAWIQVNGPANRIPRQITIIDDDCSFNIELQWKPNFRGPGNNSNGSKSVPDTSTVSVTSSPVQAPGSLHFDLNLEPKISAAAGTDKSNLQRLQNDYIACLLSKGIQRSKSCVVENNLGKGPSIHRPTFKKHASECGSKFGSAELKSRPNIHKRVEMKDTIDPSPDKETNTDFQKQTHPDPQTQNTHQDPIEQPTSPTQPNILLSPLTAIPQPTQIQNESIVEETPSNHQSVATPIITIDPLTSRKLITTIMEKTTINASKEEIARDRIIFQLPANHKQTSTTDAAYLFADFGRFIGVEIKGESWEYLQALMQLVDRQKAIAEGRLANSAAIPDCDEGGDENSYSSVNFEAPARDGDA